MVASMELFGNPSSGHRLGQAAKAAYEESRGAVAALIGAAPEEVTFVSGGGVWIAAALTPPTRPVYEVG